MSLLLRDLRLMLMGVDTGCFPYDVDKGEYRAAPGLCIDTLTPEALADRCATWVKCGSWCRRVAALVSEGGGGAVQKAFATGLEPCLRGYRCAVTEVETTTLMSFERRVKPLTRLMALMADVAWVETRGSEMPQKMALVTELYDRLVGSSEATEMALLAHLFKATITPYLRSVATCLCPLPFWKYSRIRDVILWVFQTVSLRLEVGNNLCIIWCDLRAHLELATLIS